MDTINLCLLDGLIGWSVSFCLLLFKGRRKFFLFFSGFFVLGSVSGLAFVMRCVCHVAVHCVLACVLALLPMKEMRMKNIFLLILFAFMMVGVGCTVSPRVQSCENNEDCLYGEVCREGSCFEGVSGGCKTDDDCASGATCGAMGACSVPKQEKPPVETPPVEKPPTEKPPVGCSAESGCAAGERCDTATKKCIKDVSPKGCTKDADCKNGTVCEVSSGKCIDNPNKCESSADCNNGFFCDRASSLCKTLPAQVRIQIENAVIAPSDSGGQEWDDVGVVPESVTKGVLGLLRVPGPVASVASKVIDWLQNEVGDAVSRPDPKGMAEIVSGGTFPPLVLEENSNEFIPTWGVSWKKVPLNSNLKVRIQLHDVDVLDDDNMGIASITYNDIIAALEIGKLHYVPTHKQTQNVILFVGISVFH